MKATDSENIPLCIDLDGTLVRTDLLHESVIALIKEAPLSTLSMLGWLFGGKARFKSEVARRATADPALLPYDQALIDWAVKEKRAGRKIVLSTAQHELQAARIAEHLQLFDLVMATSNDRNLSGALKAQALVEKFGDKNFDYVGDSEEDLAVWKHCRKGYVVDTRPGIVKKAMALSSEMKVWSRSSSGTFKVLAKALRVHQWAKNILVFVPIVAAHRILDPVALLPASVAFVAFSLMASSVYLVNDLMDLSSDRRHAKKKSRPVASGALPVASAVSLAIGLTFLSLSLTALTLPASVMVVLGAYATTTFLYSTWLKRLPLVDVTCLALLYIARTIAGHEATATAYSPWLLAFCLFFFFSLALVKRFSELRAKPEVSPSSDDGKLHGRGYVRSDMAIVSQLGTASGLIAVLVFALYVDSQAVLKLHPRPEFLWGIAPLLVYWVGRVWFLASRGQVDDDPVIFALKDRVSYALGLGVALFILLAASPSLSLPT